MTILVTGATGFVGRAVVSRLIKAGERPRCLVRDAERAKQALPAASLDFVTGDILRPATLDPAFAGVDLSSIAPS